MGSDSDRARWEFLSACEEGGFAGLTRVARLRRGQLAPAQAARLDALLSELRGLHEGAPPPASADGYPDRQTLAIDLQGGESPCRLRFDTAQSPPALRELLTHLDFVAGGAATDPTAT